jgi:hypothetical protein
VTPPAAAVDGPIEVHLPDGGHVVLAFADAGTRLGVGDRLIATLLRADGSEDDVGRAIQEDLRELGLQCTCSTDLGATLIVIG